jgi:hypothetical protein
MPVVRWRVMAARIGELDVRFRLNVGDRVIEKIVTFQWDGEGSFVRFIHQHIPYDALLQIATGNTLTQYIGKRGTIEVPITEPFKEPI